MKNITMIAAVGKNLELGKDNDLIERIKSDPAFAAISDKIDSILNPVNFIGRAKEQTIEYVNEVIKPILDQNKDVLGAKGQVNV